MSTDRRRRRFIAVVATASGGPVAATTIAPRVTCAGASLPGAPVRRTGLYRRAFLDVRVIDVSAAPRWTPGPETRGARSAGCTVTVCRDCCCGSVTKHPDVDHDAQVVRLRDNLPAPHRVRVSDCLDACARSNIMVVHPTPQARRTGARPVWFGFVLDDVIADDIAEWVRAGGPGVAPLPAMLELSVVAAPKD